MSKVLSEVLKDVVNMYVRKELQVEFLEQLFRLTNKYCGSTIWGTVQDVLNEYKYGQ